MSFRLRNGSYRSKSKHILMCIIFMGLYMLSVKCKLEMDFVHNAIHFMIVNAFIICSWNMHSSTCLFTEKQFSYDSLIRNIMHCVFHVLLCALFFVWLIVIASVESIIFWAGFMICACVWFLTSFRKLCLLERFAVGLKLITGCNNFMLWMTQ